MVSSGSPAWPCFLSDLVAQNRTDGSIDIDDRRLDDDRLSAFDRRPGLFDQRRHVERFFQAMILVL